MKRFLFIFSTPPSLVFLISALFLMSCQQKLKTPPTLSGVVQVVGPVSDAIVDVYALNELGQRIGGPLESVTTNEKGEYQLKKVSLVFIPRVEIVASGKDKGQSKYLDEKNEEKVFEPEESLSAIAEQNTLSSPQTKVPVTLLTTFVREEVIKSITEKSQPLNLSAAKEQALVEASQTFCVPPSAIETIPAALGFVLQRKASFAVISFSTYLEDKQTKPTQGVRAIASSEQSDIKSNWNSEMPRVRTRILTSSEFKEAMEPIIADVANCLAPSEVENLVAETEENQVALSWEPPQITGGSNIKEYKISKSADGGQTWQELTPVGPNDTRAVVTGLTNGQQYKFKVTPVNEITEGNFRESNSVSISDPSQDPPPPAPAPTPVITINTQPSNQTASSQGEANFTVHASVTESATLSYQWQKQESGAGSFSNVSGATSPTLELTGLTYPADNGDVYRVVVSATGGATSIQSNEVLLTILRSCNDGNYNSGICVNDGFCRNSSGCSCNLYEEINENAFCDFNSEQTPVITINTQPSNQTASNGSASFTVSASVTGSATLSYQWQKQESGAGSFSNVSGATSATLSLSSLTNASDNGDVYRVVVSATGGASDVTSSSATLTVSGTSCEGAGLKALDGSNRFFRYATIYDYDSCFIDPAMASANGWVVDGYVKVRFDDCNSSQGLIVESTNWYAQSDSYRVGQSYTANFGASANPTWKSLDTSVSCGNPDGTKIYVDLTEELGVDDLIEGSPDAPTSVAGTAGNAQVTLNWTAPENIGSSEIIDYVIQYRVASAGGAEPWTDFIDATSSSTNATVTGLTNDTTYVFRVAAVNSSGRGRYSSNSQGFSPNGSLAEPDSDGDNSEGGTCHENNIIYEWELWGWPSFQSCEESAPAMGECYGEYCKPDFCSGEATPQTAGYNHVFCFGCNGGAPGEGGGTICQNTMKEYETICDTCSPQCEQGSDVDGVTCCAQITTRDQTSFNESCNSVNFPTNDPADPSYDIGNCYYFCANPP